MTRLLHYRPSPAVLIAMIALFVSLGGVSYGVATGSIDSREIKNNTVRSKDIRNRAILGKDIRNDTVTSRQIRGPEAYHEVGTSGEPPFQNGATNYGAGFSTAAFFKDEEGIVHLKGTVKAKGVPAGKVIFRLPSGYRPSQILNAAVIASGSIGYVYIRPNGEIEVNRGAETGFCAVAGSPTATCYGLDSISFRAGASGAAARSAATLDPNSP
jgi:hypothetical protein